MKSLARYAVQRLLQTIPILLGVTFITFAMMHLAGSDVIEEKYANAGTIVS